MGRPRLHTLFVDNSAEIEDIIKNNPKNAFSTIAKAIIKESQVDIPVKTGKLKKSLGYWSKLNMDSKDSELQIGFHTTRKPKGTSYSHLVFPDPTTNPITRTVFKNKELIAKAIKDSIVPYLNAKSKNGGTRDFVSIKKSKSYSKYESYKK